MRSELEICAHAGCDRTLLPYNQWRVTSREERAALNAQGFFPLSGRGLCFRCYSRAKRAGTLIDYERRGFPRALLLEEWALLRSEGYTPRQAAERLGMSYDAFEKALERAAA